MRKLLPLSFLLALSVGAQAGTISFDELGAQPGFFAETNPLGNEYAGAGVTFSGPLAGSGGAILDQGSNFDNGIEAHSGRNFLAFNAGVANQGGGFSGGPETITFSTLQGSVSLWFAANPLTISAYDASNTLIATASASNVAGKWVQLGVTATGIKSVVLTGAASELGVVDDLKYEAVPEPASIAALGAGLLALRRRRR